MLNAMKEKKIKSFTVAQTASVRLGEIVYCNGMEECLLSVYENNVEALFYGSIGGSSAM